MALRCSLFIAFAYALTACHGPGQPPLPNAISQMGARSRAVDIVKTLYQWSGMQAVLPIGRIVEDSSGNLYTATQLGGVEPPTDGCGAVLQLHPPSKGGKWTATSIYEFKGGSDGCSPGTDMLPAMDAAGNLYGTAESGADGSCTGNPKECGIVFELSPPPMKMGTWTETILHRFHGGSDGSFPLGGIVLAPDGCLYGTTASVYDNGPSTIYCLKKEADGAWHNHTLYQLPTLVQATCTLLLGSDGTLYGGTLEGGSTGWGMVFALHDDAGTWKLHTLYSFKGVPDAYDPSSGLVMDSSGNLYGTTYFGGPSDAGTVYEVQRPALPGGEWIEHVLHGFSGSPDGDLPTGPPTIVSPGYLLGVTEVGGVLAGSCSRNGCGIVYSLKLRDGRWNESILHNFADNPSGRPVGTLLAASSDLYYGMASDGGGSFSGSFYSFAP